jgi:hypothetical protein
MSISRNTPPLVENLFLLAHERAVRIHIGVAKRDIAEPIATVTFQVTPADERDTRVEHFAMQISAMNPRISQALWSAIHDYVDKVSPRKHRMRLITGQE